MTQDPSEVMAKIVGDATVALFASSGIPLEEKPAAGGQPTRATIAGLIGFTGDNLRGTLMVASSFDLFARSRPAELRTQQLSEFIARDWLLLRDWGAELANQLLGRIKNQLFSHGVALRVSTPTALSGNALAVASPSSKRTRPRLFTAGREEVWVWWDVLLDPDFEMLPQDEKAAAEGDLILFLEKRSPCQPS
jgi:CheY-specific phosphatase CheX